MFSHLITQTHIKFIYHKVSGGVYSIKLCYAGYETNRIPNDNNPTPCTLEIVLGIAAISYRTHFSRISHPYNDKRFST